MSTTHITIVKISTVTTTADDGKVTTETITSIEGDPEAMKRSLEMLEIAQRLSDLGRRR